MTRVRDYISFAIWFAGLGYIAMWLLGSPDHSTLPPSLYAVGMATAVLVPVRLFLLIVKRRRAPPAISRQPAVVLRPPRRKTTYPLRAVKPRSHFGLRGVPH